MIPLVIIAGPTAGGKTALAVNVAQRFSGEVVSADSMQIYKGMNIATAKPTVEETCGIRHHLIGFLSPGEQYSVAEYVKDATDCISEIVKRKHLPVLCGGTGLYIDSLVNGIHFSGSGGDGTIREKLEAEYDTLGADELYAKLLSIDPDYAATFHKNNRARLVRALEIYYTDGITMSQQIEQSRHESGFDPCYIVLDFADRAFLYDRINMRVDSMLERGLLGEARHFCFGTEKSKTSYGAIGYKELAPYFDGSVSLEVAVESLKQATRHYAKRQLTWFRRNPNAQHLFVDTMTKEELVCLTEEIIEKHYEGKDYFCSVTKHLSV